MPMMMSYDCDVHEDDSVEDNVHGNAHNGDDRDDD